MSEEITNLEELYQAYLRLAEKVNTGYLTVENGKEILLSQMVFDGEGKLWRYNVDGVLQVSIDGENFISGNPNTFTLKPNINLKEYPNPNLQKNEDNNNASKSTDYNNNSGNRFDEGRNYYTYKERESNEQKSKVEREKKPPKESLKKFDMNTPPTLGESNNILTLTQSRPKVHYFNEAKLKKNSINIIRYLTSGLRKTILIFFLSLLVVILTLIQHNGGNKEIGKLNQNTSLKSHSLENTNKPVKKGTK